MIQDEQIEYGGSAAAIRHHYDVGNDFYSAWLDPSMTYSSAMWDGLPKDARWRRRSSASSTIMRNRSAQAKACAYWTSAVAGAA